MIIFRYSQNLFFYFIESLGFTKSRLDSKLFSCLISRLSILNYVDMDSEESVLGYGFSLILLNGLMYVGIPAVVIIGIRKKF